jgi:hypothetical protein
MQGLLLVELEVAYQILNNPMGQLDTEAGGEEMTGEVDGEDVVERQVVA